MKLRIVCSLILCGLMAACNNSATSSQVACGSSDANDLVGKIVKDELEKQTVAGLTDAQNKIPEFKNVGIQQLRDIVGQLKFSLADVRTSEKSQTSSKLLCEANLRIEVPDNVLQAAKESNKIIDPTSGDNTNFIDKYFKKENGFYIQSVSYSVQPTDDGKKIFASLNEAGTIVSHLTDLVFLASSRNLIVDTKKQMDEQAAANEAEIEALNQQQMQDKLNEAKEKHKLALSEINSFWNKLPKPVQNKLQASQIAWNKSHKSECEYSSKEIEDPIGQQAALLLCKADRIEERLTELRNAEEGMGNDLLKDAQKEAFAARDQLQATINKLPPEIGSSLNDDIDNINKTIDSKCNQAGDNGLQAKLKSYECMTKEYKIKNKEFEGYIIQ